MEGHASLERPQRCASDGEHTVLGSANWVTSQRLNGVATSSLPKTVNPDTVEISSVKAGEVPRAGIKPGQPYIFGRYRGADRKRS